MYFHDKVFDASTRWLGALADASAARVLRLRKTLAVLDDARVELKEVARRQGSRFMKQNSPLFMAVRKEVSDIARSTYRTLLDEPRAKQGRGKESRKRARKAA